jgi:endonuclease III
MQRVNMVTPSLFARYPDPASLRLLRRSMTSPGSFAAPASTGTRPEHHQGGQPAPSSRQHGGAVPPTMEELTALCRRVGRKTANVVLGNAFGIPGFPVDTHVRRIARLLALTDAEDPVVIEKELCAITAEEAWTDASHLFILHGRATCIARRPRCADCVIAKECPSAASIATAL